MRRISVVVLVLLAVGGSASTSAVAAPPPPVDLSRADSCDFIGAQGSSLCLLPFPDNYYTVADPSSATGRRVNLSDQGTPQNSSGVPIAAAPYNFNDGFSPGQTTVVRVPGLDTPDAFAATDPIPLNDLSRNEELRANEPVVVIDAETGQRWPIWVELDSNSSTPEQTGLLIHPARNYAAGHRYIVAMRNLKDGEGDVIPAPNGFIYYRDDRPSREPAINAQRERFKSIFQTLKNAGIKRGSLYLAWDFTVSSDENIAERMLHIRDDAFAQLGDTDLDDLEVQGDAPSFTVTSVENFTPVEDAEMARRVQGTFQVPCYLQPNCAPGKPLRARRGRAAEPERNLDGELQLRDPSRRGRRPGRLTRPATDLRPRPAGDGQRGDLRAPATPRPDPQLRRLRNRRDRLLPIRPPDRRREHPAQPLELPQAHRPGPAGAAQRAVPGRLMIHGDGFLSDAAFHVDPGDAAAPPMIERLAALLQRQQPGRHPRRRVDGDRAGLHPGVARGAGDELLGAAQPRGRLRQL